MCTYFEIVGILKLMYLLLIWYTETPTCKIRSLMVLQTFENCNLFWNRQFSRRKSFLVLQRYQEIYIWSCCQKTSHVHLWPQRRKCLHNFNVSIILLGLHISMHILTPWKESYDQPRQHIKKQRHYFVNKGLSCQGYGFPSGHVWIRELDYKESWAQKSWCFWTVVLEKTLESPLDCKEIQPVHPQGDQSWVFIGRTDVEAETPTFWSPDAKRWLIWKDPDAGKDRGQEENGTTEDEMVGWHHWFDGCGFGWTPGVGDGQGGLACCSSQGCKELDMTERLNWTECVKKLIFRQKHRVGSE